MHLVNEGMLPPNELDDRDERLELQELNMGNERKHESVADIGNAAAMREALKLFIDAYRETSYSLCIENLRPAYQKADAALSAPPRNCNRHTGWLTAIKEFNDTEGRCKPWGDDIYDTRFLDWLFAPAAERKGDGDESK